MQPSQNKLRILCLYASSQTYTPTVFEHVDSFRKYSEHSWYYMDFTDLATGKVDLSCFDVVVVHYSVRLPFGQLCDEGARKLSVFQGLKVLFIQDEYDHTSMAKALMRQAGFQLIFTVVPAKSISLVYPAAEFPGVTFVNNLTGYVPDDLGSASDTHTLPSQRERVIAYRGRPLPVRYGRLGQEKVQIGKKVKEYCELKRIQHDIAWSEESRIYGDAWYQFISSSKAMLGSESGSNVFDWDGGLQDRIDQYAKENSGANEVQIYDAVVASPEIDGLMNQISPRVFEMIAACTVMVLFEGEYSGVLKPYRHYLPLKKDFSNIEDVFNRLNDARLVDEIATNAYEDIINSGQYSYRSFVSMVDQQINQALEKYSVSRATNDVNVYRLSLEGVDSSPVRAKPPLPSFLTKPSRYFVVTKLKLALSRIVMFICKQVPMSLRPAIKKMLGRA